MAAMVMVVGLGSPCVFRAPVAASATPRGCCRGLRPLSTSFAGGARLPLASKALGAKTGAGHVLQVVARKVRWLAAMLVVLASHGKGRCCHRARPTASSFFARQSIGAVLASAKADLVAAPFALLGALLAVQTFRVRFQFDAETLKVSIGEDKDPSENAFVGGDNRWSYKSFTNWEFWWPGFPVLVYFKETQTKPEGQIHFFPVIMNGKQLYDTMVERCGPSQTSGPKN
eukprot:jgi/Chlat1/4545/Chrsp29S04456